MPPTPHCSRMSVARVPNRPVGLRRDRRSRHARTNLSGCREALSEADSTAPVSEVASARPSCRTSGRPWANTRWTSGCPAGLTSSLCPTVALILKRSCSHQPLSAYLFHGIGLQPGHARRSSRRGDARRRLLLDGRRERRRSAGAAGEARRPRRQVLPHGAADVEAPQKIGR